MSILDWLGIRRGPGPAVPTETEVVRRITTALNEMEPDRARYLAAFAYLLGRVAHADQQVTDAETRTMERIVMEEGGLPEAQAIIVVQIAKAESFLFGGSEDFNVTQEFREVATDEQKRSLLRCLFAVSASDDAVVTAEDNEIRRISMELKIPHQEFIEARSAWREQLRAVRDVRDPVQGV
ncbi:MAG: TerB family tellurite resistance protein [Acidobacteria bacterium]|nr:TerB family tellurite resistance protein [Acidobacteriota bacterium]